MKTTDSDAMTLRRLIEGVTVKAVLGDADIPIAGLSSDSRDISSGDIYVAFRGEVFDGHDFIGEAIGKGAAGIVCDAPPSDASVGEARLSVVLVDDTRKAIAAMAGNYYGRPSERLTVIGVTGTNGKTTTTYLIKSILEAAGLKTGLIGTISYMVGDSRSAASHTTPEALDFQRLLRSMLDAGLSHAVAEVSSHALAQRRVDGTGFKAAVFTNLTRDHLDFHKSMEEYFNVKKRLFSELLTGIAVINRDDPYGRRLLTLPGLDALSFGIDESADLTATDIRSTKEGISFRLKGGGLDMTIDSSLVGLTNVYNILSAAGSALALGVKAGAILEGIRSLKNVEGRFQKVALGQKFLCVVDYAHTEDALRRLILTAREITPKGGGRVITVFGCGGQRDKGKRPTMGAAATELSELVFITTDNPRDESPEDIIKEIVSGAARANYYVIPDRKEAIHAAIAAAEASDTVLIAGKGHEEYQEIKGVKHPFSDRAVAEEAIREHIKSKAGIKR